MTAAALWLNTFFAGFDESVTSAVHSLYLSAGPILSPFFEFISLLGKGGIFLIVLSFALMFFKKTRLFGTAMLIGVTVGAIFTNLFLKVLIARPRPYADESGFYYQLWTLLGSHMESDKSFPSGHTTAAFATMTAVFFVGDKRVSWTAFIFGILMGISRIYLVVHFPSDVLGGIIVGFAAGFIGAMIALKLPEKWYALNLIKKKEREGDCSDSESSDLKE